MPSVAASAKRPLAAILHRDDDVRRAMVQALRPHVDVRESRDGVEGLGLVLEAHPDLLVVGSVMPRLNGLGVCRILRDHGADVPILFLPTAGAAPNERASALAVGADECVVSADPAHLVTRAMRLLACAKAEEERSWPTLDVAAALARLGPTRVHPGVLAELLWVHATRAREVGATMCLLGYEFPVAELPDGARFADVFDETLARTIRAEDVICRLTRSRLVAVLVGCDRDGARTVVRRVHERTSAAHDALGAAGRSQPKALYHFFLVHAQRPDGEPADENLLDRLFEEPPKFLTNAP